MIVHNPMLAAAPWQCTAFAIEEDLVPSDPNIDRASLHGLPVGALPQAVYRMRALRIHPLLWTTQLYFRRNGLLGERMHLLQLSLWNVAAVPSEIVDAE